MRECCSILCVLLGPHPRPNTHPHHTHTTPTPHSHHTHGTTHHAHTTPTKPHTTFTFPFPPCYPCSPLRPTSVTLRLSCHTDPATLSHARHSRSATTPLLPLQLHLPHVTPPLNHTSHTTRSPTMFSYFSITAPRPPYFIHTPRQPTPPLRPSPRLKDCSSGGKINQAPAEGDKSGGPRSARHGQS